MEKAADLKPTTFIRHSLEDAKPALSNQDPTEQKLQAIAQNSEVETIPSTTHPSIRPVTTNEKGRRSQRPTALIRFIEGVTQSPYRIRTQRSKSFKLPPKNSEVEPIPSTTHPTIQPLAPNGKQPVACTLPHMRGRFPLNRESKTHGRSTGPTGPAADL